MTAEQLLKSLPEPIAVVGNGMMRNQGAEIDSFATVIRFNNYVLAPEFDIHVGKRTDVWCINCNWQDVKRRDWNGPILTTSMLSENADVAKWLERYPQLAVPETPLIGKAKAYFPGHIYRLGENPRSPSTGVTLLIAMILEQKDFAAFGFDGLRGGHYWNPSDQHNHGWDEFDAIKALIRDEIAIQ